MSHQRKRAVWILLAVAAISFGAVVLQVVFPP
jgi:hypothetical protein